MIVCSAIAIDLSDVEGINQIVALTDAPFDITYQGTTYRAFGSLLKIDRVSIENTLNNKSMKVTLSGIDTNLVTLINSTAFRNKSVTITKCYVPEETNAVSSSEVYYRGVTDTPEYTVNYSQGFMTLGIVCKSVYDLSQKPSLSRSNNATHQLYHTGDLFFQYANNSVLDDELWIRK